MSVVDLVYDDLRKELRAKKSAKARFGAQRAVKIQSDVFCVMRLCRGAVGYQHFRGHNSEDLDMKGAEVKNSVLIQVESGVYLKINS
jgi:hypothetical protein